MRLARGGAAEAGDAARQGLTRLADADVLDHGELLARLHHAEAAAARAAGDFALAASLERRAELALTTLDDDDEITLRLSVALARGNDSLALDDHHDAFRHHARASELSQRLGRPVEELRALVGMAGAALALGRRHDAAAMIERALHVSLAIEPLAPESVDVLERNLRKHLLALGDGPGSVRWERLDALLAERDAAPEPSVR